MCSISSVSCLRYCLELSLAFFTKRVTTYEFCAIIDLPDTTFSIAE